MYRRYERWRWITFGLTWVIYASLYLTRKAFSAVKVSLPDDPRIKFDRSQYGLVDSAQLTAYMCGQFLFGPLGDRFGPRRLILGGLAVSILAAVATGFSTTLTAFVVLAVVQGLAQSTGWSNLTKTMSSWFSLRERGRVIGWWCSHYAVGSAVAGPLAGWMMLRWARSVSASSNAAATYWPAGFWGPAAILAVVLVVAFVFLRSRPEDLLLPPIEEYHGEPQSLITGETPAEAAQEGSWQVVGEVLRTKSIWLLGAAYFSIKFARYAFDSWGAQFVAESFKSDALVSNITAAAMPLGGVVGLVVSGFVSDRVFQSRRAPAAVLSLAAAAAVMFIGLARFQSIWVMVAFFFMSGFFLYGPDTMISGTAAVDFGTKRGAGTATGFVNGIGSIGGILGGWLPGQITTKGNWTGLFYVMLIGLVISALLLTPLWNVRPPSTREKI